MKEFRVEFNSSGFYSGDGIWEVLDETDHILANNAAEAIELVKDWWLESSSSDYDDAKIEIESFAFRAAEIKYDEDSLLEPYVWEFD